METVVKVTYPGIDIFKFIMSILVVAVHTIGINSFFLLAVPYFFIASGFFLFKDFSKERVKGYLIKLVRIYLVWTIIYLPFALKVFFDERLTVVESILSLFRGFLLVGANNGSWHLWYILALIVAVLIIDYLVKVKVNFIFIFLLSLFFYLLGFVLDKLHDISLNFTILNSLVDIYFRYFVSTQNGLFVGFFYICLGAIAVKSKRNMMFILLMLFLGLLFCFFDVLIIGIPLLAFSIFLWSSCPDFGKIIGKSISLRLRKMSFVIYIIHFLFIDFIKVYKIVPSGMDMFILTVFLVLLVSFIITEYSNTRWYRILFN